MTRVNYVVWSLLRRQQRWQLSMLLTLRATAQEWVKATGQGQALTWLHRFRQYHAEAYAGNAELTTHWPHTHMLRLRFEPPKIPLMCFAKYSAIWMWLCVAVCDRSRLVALIGMPHWLPCGVCHENLLIYFANCININFANYINPLAN